MKIAPPSNCVQYKYRQTDNMSNTFYSGRYNRCSRGVINGIMEAGVRSIPGGTGPDGQKKSENDAIKNNRNPSYIP